ncbi:MAG: pyridoxamine 5'-phosphate oxidase family protein [Candidatus Heimdallarchaeota archaeon]
MNKHQFTFSFIEKQIRKKTFGILTTINQDGTPHSTGILFGVSPPFSKFVLYFFTSREYKKVRNIKRNPYVSLIIPFPHYYIRFAPSGTVTFNGKADFISIDDIDVHDIFSKKRVLRLVIKEIETQDTESLTFVRIIPNPKVLCFGVGYNVFKLRKDHRQGGYSVIIPQERLLEI